MSVLAEAINELHVLCVSVLQVFVGEDFAELKTDKHLLSRVDPRVSQKCCNFPIIFQYCRHRWFSCKKGNTEKNTA
jgi:hypothetical protein